MGLEKQILLAVSLLALISTIKGFNVTDCGSKKGKFNKVEIVGCDTTQSSCILKRGTEVKVKIEFVPAENASSLEVLVHGVFGDHHLRYPFIHPDACRNSGIKCPLKSGTTYEYEGKLRVLTFKSIDSFQLTWELQDKNGYDIVCVIFPAALK